VPIASPLRGGRALAAAGLMVAGLIMISSCSGPSLSVQATTATTAGTLENSAHTVTYALGTTTAATLDVESGATSVNVTVGALGSPLVAAATAPASGQIPVLAAGADHTIDLQLRSNGGGGASAVNVVLSPTVVWTIDLDGGATVERVDLRHGRLSALNLSAGTSRADVYLPARLGTQVVHETGGVNALTVTAPPGLAVKVRADGGAGAIHLHGVTHTGVSGGSTYSDPGYSSAAMRAFLILSGGVSDVVVRSHG
jgi:hypothetical protein